MAGCSKGVGFRIEANPGRTAIFVDEITRTDAETAHWTGQKIYRALAQEPFRIYTTRLKIMEAD